MNNNIKYVENSPCLEIIFKNRHTPLKPVKGFAPIILQTELFCRLETPFYHSIFIFYLSNIMYIFIFLCCFLTTERVYCKIREIATFLEALEFRSFTCIRPQRTNTGGHGFRIMCPSGATFLSADCCFSEVAL